MQKSLTLFFFFLFSFFFTNPSLLVAQESSKGNALSETERADLEQYFRYMLSESQGGYVLFGTKPVCGEAIYSRSPVKKPFATQWSLWEASEIIRRGTEVWNRLKVNKSPAPVHIVTHKKSNKHWNYWHEVLWVNTSSCEKVVQEALPLFKYIVGPSTTAESLTAQIINPELSLDAIFQENKVLIGIIFGFGIENSILHSRTEHIEESAWQPEHIPLLPRHLRTGIPSPFVKEGLFATNASIPHFSIGELIPSVGYSSLKEEHAELNKQIATSTEGRKHLSPPIPTFGYIKDDLASQEILEAYEEDQKKIADLLRSPTFFDDVIEHILGYQPEVLLVEATPKKEEPVQAELAKMLTTEDSKYLEYALEGMQLEHGASKEAIYKYHPHIIKFIKAEALNQAHQNLAKSEQALKQVSQDTSMQTLVPNKLYYKTVKAGHGAQQPIASFVRLQCAIEDLIADSYTPYLPQNSVVDVNSDHLIYGLRYAIHNMRLGETREVVIHPDYAYGCQANFTPATALKAYVTLLSVEGDQKQLPSSIPSLNCRDQLPKKIDPSEMKQLKKEAAISEGRLLHQLSLHYPVMHKALYSNPQL